MAGGDSGGPGRGDPDRGRARSRPAEAGAEARRLGPVIGFLAAILVLAHLCDDDGLFRACGGVDGAHQRGQPSGQAPGAGLR